MTPALCWSGLQGDKPVAPALSHCSSPSCKPAASCPNPRGRDSVAPCAVPHPMQTPPGTRSGGFLGKHCLGRDLGKSRFSGANTVHPQGAWEAQSSGILGQLWNWENPALELGRISGTACSPGLGQVGGAGRHSWVSLSVGTPRPPCPQFLRDYLI